MPGGRVDTIRSTDKWQALLNYKPDLIILLLGGNDIRVDMVPRDLAHSLEELVLEIEAQSGGSTLLLSIEHRTWVVSRRVSPN